MSETDPIHELIEDVRANPKYKDITIDIIQQLSQDALARGLGGKAAVKAVRNKLHQIGGAYFRKRRDFKEWEAQLESLPHDSQSAETRQYCRQIMAYHSSTAERLPILEDFFQTCLASIAPVHSVLDLACGMNPFSIPWMPLTERYTYFACDIYEDMLKTIEHFFHHHSIHGATMPCNLLTGVPSKETQVALLLKSIPCLEQINKTFGTQILDMIPAKNVLVSYPVHSLGGRKKGMPGFYRQHFSSCIDGKPWKVTEFQFQTELAFLVCK